MELDVNAYGKKIQKSTPLTQKNTHLWIKAKKLEKN
jgi:hypothetical protein